MNKKCPLCDEPAVISHELTTTNVVYCGNPACPCNWHGMTEEVWNHRPEEERLQARITELEAEVTRLRGANRWISVEERLPESETVVIVYDRAKDIVCEGYLSSEAGGWCENTWWLRRLHNVTHWMPKVLPEPPEGGEG